MTEPSGPDEVDEAHQANQAHQVDEAHETHETHGANEPGGSGGPAAPVGWLPRGAEALFGEGATAEEAYGLLTVDVPAGSWIPALETARDQLGCTYFDWLSAVDEPGTGFRVCAHVAALPPAGGGPVHRLVLRTTVPHEAPALPTATGVYAGAAWHERETHEMFGLAFADHPHLVPLLLPDGFEGHPLRKDFVLAARVAKAWPGAKEPGESGHGGPKRRQMLPPGVPDTNEWGPLKGQLPPVPARPARGRAAAAGERPARRTRTADAGSASQRQRAAEPEESASGSEAPPGRPARRTRTASGGSASQRDATTDTDARPEAPAEAPPGKPAPSPASPAPGTAREKSRETGPETGPEQARAREQEPDARSADAPWHHARPAFDASGSAPAPNPAPSDSEGEGTEGPRPEAGPEPEPGSESAAGSGPGPGPGGAGGDDGGAARQPGGEERGSDG